MSKTEAQSSPKAKGFSTLSPERLKEIAILGGKARAASGKGHFFNSETGREAGKKGGSIISKNRAHMSAIGKKGGINAARIKAGISK